MSEMAERVEQFNPVLPNRTRVTEYLLRVNEGTREIVSQLGPCVCGAAKREWHKICLMEKERNHG